MESLRRKYAYKKLDDQQLKEYVKAHPDQFLSEIAKEFLVTPQAIFYAFKRLKITRKKKTTLYQERDEEKRRVFLEALSEIPEIQRIYLDESGINKYLYRQYGWALRVEKIVGEISGHRFARESVISAISGGKFLAAMCFQGTCDSKLFNIWLEKILIPELKPRQVLILDNASFHKSAESKKLVEEAGCKLLFLPSYSPDLNPIEKYWANMKVKVRELLPKLQNLTEALDEAILSM